jgi:hypothetical protein
MAEPFSVEDETGFMVYSNMNYNSNSVNSFRVYQINLINFCQDLINLKEKLTNLKEKYGFITMDISPSITDISPSITMSGGLVYNNIKIERDPERTVEEGQSWQIRWNTDWGQPQNMSFNRVYKSKQSLTIEAIQAAYDYAYTTYKANETVKIGDARLGARTLTDWNKVWENAGPAASAWADAEAQWIVVKDVVIAEAKKGARTARTAREAMRMVDYGDVVGTANAAEAAAAEAAAPSRIKAVEEATALLAQAKLLAAGGGNKIRKRTKGKKIKRKKRKKTKKTN